jgi:hypothetical protein
MLDQIMFLSALFLITCVNVPMALVYLGKREHNRRLQERLQARRARSLAN